jgi:membrane protease YdiL (CAAX protease family)
MFLTLPYIFSEFILIVCLPILAMFSSPAILKARHIFMVIGLIYILFLLTKINLQPIITTLTLPAIKPIIYYCLIPSFILSIIIIIVHRYYPTLLVDTTKVINFSFLPRYAPLILYPLLSVPLQEIIFRWFYVGRFDGSPLSIILIIFLSALVFGLIHLPFGNPALFIGTFLLGLWWNTIYLMTGNLWYSIISHSILGNTLILLALYPSFFTFKFSTL